MDDLLEQFSLHGPALAIQSDNVLFLREPDDFINEILASIRRATHSVVLASLYLGTGKAERDIVTHLDQFLERNPNGTVTLLFDCLRGTRGLTTATSTIDMLLPLVRTYGSSRVRLCLFHTPALSGLLKRILPERYNETVGVSHIKAYLFDDDAIISGANLSDWYFIDRQDRYLVLRNSPDVVQWFTKLVSTVCDLSYSVPGPSSDLVAPTLADPVNEPEKFKKTAREKLLELVKPNEGRVALGEHDTWIFPTIQYGLAGVHHDERTMLRLLKDPPLPSPHVLCISSPYFNFTQHYISAMLASSAQSVDIITASPKANGFFSSKGLSSHIPSMYSHFALSFLSSLRNHAPAIGGGDTQSVTKKGDHGHHPPVRVFEYVRPGWTFHGKGLWLCAPAENEEGASASAAAAEFRPCVVSFGSPNFGYRSVHRDLEAQIFVVTTNKNLQSLLEEERRFIFANKTEQVTLETFLHPTRRVSKVWSIVGKFLRTWF